ncbi:MAG TPA: hydroxymethylbilane synthase [Chloroflexia bacterium]|nr:hydroxymethylbilane synthase [Chloroflexia bacterium]
MTEQAEVTFAGRGQAAGRPVLLLGTRASKLALAQSEIVRQALLDVRPDLEVRFETITTKGDVVQDRPLSEIGGNGLFVTAIEEALRAGTIDLAVHSAKDLSSVLPSDMALAAFLPRADARDVLVSREGHTLKSLPSGAVLGTSSPRRTCQALALRPDLRVLDIRGNVDTRLRKLYAGEYDAIVLAGAGLARLGLLDRVTEWLDPGTMLPAVAQGALAVEVRASDSFMRDLAGQLDDPATSTAVRAERAFLAAIGGGCSLPVGAYATLEGDSLRLGGMIGAPDGRMLRGERVGDSGEPEQVGRELVAELLAGGGRELIAESEALAR